MEKMLEEMTYLVVLLVFIITLISVIPMLTSDVRPTNNTTISPCDCEQFNGNEIPKDVLLDCYLTKIKELQHET